MTDEWERLMTRQSDREPRLNLLESCWSFQARLTPRVISCGVYETDFGIELRLGYSADDIITIEYFRDGVAAARARATEWRAKLIKMGFVEIPEGRA